MTFEFLLTCFLLIIPIFGKAINYGESLILYGGIVIFTLFSFFYQPIRHLNKKFLIFETILFFFSLLSTIFSQNIGYSYYGLFNFISVLVLLNLCLSYLDTQKLFKYILYFSLFYSLIFLLYKFNIITIHLASPPDHFILQVWGHSYLADFLIFPYLFSLYSLFKKKIYLLPTLFFLLLIILTNSRSAIVAIAICTIYILLPKITKKFRLTLAFVTIGLTLIFCYQNFYQNQNIKSLDGARPEYWNQAIKAFIDHPLLGNGPNNFFYINKKYQSIPNSDTNYAHNSFLEFLCLNGLPFTMILFTVIILSLLYQRRQNPLNFLIALTAIINSLLDPSWNSTGIFCLSLFFIFSNNPNIVNTKKSKNNSLFTIITLILISIFFLSKTASDYLFINGNTQTSLYVDPFNLNPRIKLSPKYLPSTLVLYKNNYQLYQQLIKNIPIPQSENYYLTYLSLNPLESINEYQNLSEYFLEHQEIDNFINVFTTFIDRNPSLSPIPKTINLIYQNAVKEFLIDKNKSITLFKLLVKYYPHEGHFQVDLANAYWHNNQKDFAFNILQLCQKNLSARDQCHEYLNAHTNNQNFNSPGQPDFIEYVNKQFPIN